MRQWLLLICALFLLLPIAYPAPVSFSADMTGRGLWSIINVTYLNLTSGGLICVANVGCFNLTQMNASSGASGDITSVTAGTCQTGGATSGGATLNVNLSCVNDSLKDSFGQDLYLNASGDSVTVTTGYIYTSSFAGNSLYIDANADAGSSTSTGGALRIDSTGNDGAAIIVYSNDGASSSGRLLNLRADNNAFDQAAFHIDYDGNTNAVEIVYDNNDTSGQALNIVSSNNNDTTVGISGSSTDKGVVKIVHTFNNESQMDDSSSSAISIELQGNKTKSQGIFIDALGGTTGKFVRFKNSSVDKFYIEVNGTAYSLMDFCIMNSICLSSLTGVGDITAVLGQSGLQGGATSGSAVLTLNETHANLTIDNRIIGKQNNITAQTCSGTDKFSSFASGTFTCTTDTSGSGGAGIFMVVGSWIKTNISVAGTVDDLTLDKINATSINASNYFDSLTNIDLKAIWRDENDKNTTALQTSSRNELQGNNSDIRTSVVANSTADRASILTNITDVRTSIVGNSSAVAATILTNATDIRTSVTSNSTVLAASILTNVTDVRSTITVNITGLNTSVFDTIRSRQYIANTTHGNITRLYATNITYAPTANIWYNGSGICLVTC